MAWFRGVWLAIIAAPLEHPSVALQRAYDEIAAVADEYADLLNWIDEICLRRKVSFSGRGGKWRLFVSESHGEPGFNVWEDSPLELIAEFRRQWNEEYKI